MTQLADTVGINGNSVQDIDAPCHQTPVTWGWEGMQRDSLVPILSGVGLAVPSLLEACGTPEGNPDTVNTVDIVSPRAPWYPAPCCVILLVGQFWVLGFQHEV